MNFISHVTRFKIKKPLFVFCGIILLFSLTVGCEEDKTIHTTGRVAFINLEGGFFGIYGDDGNSYDPVNLSAEFKKDSLRILFEGKILTGQATTHMWGKLLQLSKIERLQ